MEVKLTAITENSAPVILCQGKCIKWQHGRDTVNLPFRRVWGSGGVGFLATQGLCQVISDFISPDMHCKPKICLWSGRQGIVEWWYFMGEALCTLHNIGCSAHSLAESGPNLGFYGSKGLQDTSRWGVGGSLQQEQHYRLLYPCLCAPACVFMCPD